MIFVDEATNLTEKQLRAITACCRGVNDFPKHVYFTMNPGGPGHGFIKRLFIDRRFNDRENPDEYTFIQALVDDNTALVEAQPDYVAQLEALPGKLREAWRFGRWDVFEGQVFGEFVDDPEHYKDRRFSHVIEPFKVPESWRIYRGFDWGYAKPFSVGWYAMDHDNIMYRIRELYGCTGERSSVLRILRSGRRTAESPLQRLCRSTAFTLPREITSGCLGRCSVITGWHLATRGSRSSMCSILARTSSGRSLR